MKHPLVVEGPELLSRFEGALKATTRAALAFDADGTLWSGDVGEDVFLFAVERGLLKDAAREALSGECERAGVSAAGASNELALRLMQAYRSGSVTDLRACEFMTWCYAGWREGELRELVQTALAEKTLERRFQRELSPIFEWARSAGVRTVVISASPRVVVEEATVFLGIPNGDIEGADPVICDGVISAAMAAPVPFAEVKSELGLSMLDGATWIASFGDNVYDLPMLRAATFGVAVRPKPALLSAMATVDGLVVLARRDDSEERT